MVAQVLSMPTKYQEQCLLPLKYTDSLTPTSRTTRRADLTAAHARASAPVVQGQSPEDHAREHAVHSKGLAMLEKLERANAAPLTRRRRAAQPDDCSGDL